MTLSELPSWKSSRHTAHFSPRLNRLWVQLHCMVGMRLISSVDSPSCLASATAKKGLSLEDSLWSLTHCQRKCLSIGCSTPSSSSKSYSSTGGYSSLSPQSISLRSDYESRLGSSSRGCGACEKESAETEKPRSLKIVTLREMSCCSEDCPVWPCLPAPTLGSLEEEEAEKESSSSESQRMSFIKYYWAVYSIYKSTQVCWARGI